MAWTVDLRYDVAGDPNQAIAIATYTFTDSQGKNRVFNYPPTRITRSSPGAFITAAKAALTAWQATETQRTSDETSLTTSLNT